MGKSKDQLVASHDTVLLVGHSISKQFVAQPVPGSTVTLKVQVLLVPEQSVTVLVTVVVPRGKTDPDGGTVTSEKVLQQTSVTPTE